MSEQLKYKMYNHEVVPPGDVWNAIQQHLEAQEMPGALKDKMLSYEVIPPDGAWQHIASALRTTTPVRNIGSSIRWLAAAVVIGFLVSGSYYFFNSGNTVNDTTASAGSTINPDQAKKTVPLAGNLPSRNKTNTVISSDYNSPDPVEKAPVERKRERILHSSLVKNADIIEDEEVVIHARQIMNESGEPIHDMSVVNPSNDKYISITAPNGQQTKISSKLAIAMPYVGFLNSEGQGLSENNWKQLIEEWRARIMQSGFVPSSGNFLDILELTELIKD